MLWRDPVFLRVWAAGGISGVGARITREGLPLIAVLVLHASPGEIGILAALRAAPALLVGLGCGAWVDRSQRRPILIAADLARAAALLLVPFAALAHRLAVAEVWLAAAAVGGLSSLFEMADHAYLPGIVERGALVRANAVLGATDSVAEIGGPALTGLLFGWLSAPLALILNSASYLASAIILGGVARAEPPPEAMIDHAEGVLGSLKGLRLTLTSPTAGPLLGLVLTLTLFGSFFSALYIPFAIRDLGLTPAMLGLTIAVGGVGALAGAAVAPILARRQGLGVALIVTAALNALFNVFVPLAGGSPTHGMACLMTAQLLGDAAGTAVYIYVASLRQGLLPPGQLGRVAGAFAAAGGLAAIIGALAGGWLGVTFGIRPTLFAACAGMALAPLWALAAPIRRLRSLTEGGPAPGAD